MTAVEWLENEMQKTYIFNQNDFDMFKQAKEMEKQQIINAASWIPKPFGNIEFLPELAKQYYNETFNK
jgi:hypothetical protein